MLHCLVDTGLGGAVQVNDEGVVPNLCLPIPQDVLPPATLRHTPDRHWAVLWEAADVGRQALQVLVKPAAWTCLEAAEKALVHDAVLYAC